MTKRGSFGPVVLLGLGSAAMAAVAGTKTWTEVSPPGGDCSLGYAVDLDFSRLAQDAPLAGALSLVVLAAWGVVLVSRGRLRRAAAIAAALASAGYLATAVSARSFLKDDVARQVIEKYGAPGNGCAAATVNMNNTWWLAALAAGAIAVLASALAVLLVRHWPEMGSKYDAPAGAAAAAVVPLAEQSSVDLWKSLDAGVDPTVHPDADADGDEDLRA